LIVQTELEEVVK